MPIFLYLAARLARDLGQPLLANSRPRRVAATLLGFSGRAPSRGASETLVCEPLGKATLSNIAGENQSAFRRLLVWVRLRPLYVYGWIRQLLGGSELLRRWDVFFARIRGRNAA